MTNTEHAMLERMAAKYIWWKTPAEALAMPARVIAQVMDIGDHSDMHELAETVGDDVLRDVLAHAEAGQFRARSWHYWHYRLDLVKLGEVPEMPTRRFE